MNRLRFQADCSARARGARTRSLREPGDAVQPRYVERSAKHLGKLIVRVMAGGRGVYRQPIHRGEETDQGLDERGIAEESVQIGAEDAAVA